MSAIVTRAKVGLLARVGLLALMLAGSGCIIVADDDWDDDWDDGYQDSSDVILDEPVVVAIDVGATVGELDPGFGAGLFVEVGDDGRWHVFTTCDTDVSGYACGWEIFVRGEGVELTDVVDLESEDDVDAGGDAIDAYFVTDFDVDEIAFATAPGALVELTMFLDGASQPSFVYWVGDGVQNEGAPTNPLIFEPR